jgi:hypothetical protein
MTDELNTWERPHYVRTDAAAMLFFAAYGNLDLVRLLSGSRYRTAGPPAGFDFMAYARTTQPDVLSRFCEGYVWDELKETDSDRTAQIEAAPACAILSGELPDPPTLDYLQDAVGLITWLFDVGACAVYDPQTLRWWTSEEWREELFDPDAPVPRHHVTILISDDADGAWVHTRGMRKFARPDVSVRRIPTGYEEAVLDLCDRFIEFMAFGGLPADGEQVRMRSLPPGGVVRHGGSLDDPDFNNVHLEVVWPG